MRSPLWKWLPGFPGNLCLLPLFGIFFLLLPRAMTSGWVTHHPGSHLTYSGSPFLALALPCYLPLGAKEEAYGKVAVTSEQELRPQKGRLGHCGSMTCHHPDPCLPRVVINLPVGGAGQAGCDSRHPRLVTHACIRQLSFFLQQNILMNTSTHSF